MHVFPEDMWHVLESEERRKREPPERLAGEIERRVGGVERGIAFDIGAGTGYFTEVLSGLFKKVYAVERSEKLARILASKGLKNVGVIVSEKPPPVDFEVDLVLFADSLHEISCRKEYARWCERSKYLVVVEWKKGECLSCGPPDSHRLSVDEILTLFDSFEFEEIDIYPCHYVLFGRRRC